MRIGRTTLRFPLRFVCFIFCFYFYFYLCFYLFSYFVFVFCFCFCFCLFRISLFQCISVADVCMLCLSYPILGHDIALSNALRCIISVSWLVTTELIFLGWRISTDNGCAGCRRVENGLMWRTHTHTHMAFSCYSCIHLYFFLFSFSFSSALGWPSVYW